MKSVLPALVGKGYEGLEIQNGGTASTEFLRMVFGKLDSVEKQKIRTNLEKYCRLDTLGMVWILDYLQELTS